MKSALGQQIVEVIAGHATRDVGIALANEIRVTVAQVAQRGVHLPPAPAVFDDAPQLVLVDGSYGHSRAVGEHNFELFHVVRRPPGHDRMDAARVVADHPAECRVRVCRGVRRKGKPMGGLGDGRQLVADDARLHPREPTFGVDFLDLAQVLRGVDADGVVRRLP